jgi:hypothetical protein
VWTSVKTKNREGSRVKAKKHGGVFTHVTHPKLAHAHETPKDGPGKYTKYENRTIK